MILILAVLKCNAIWHTLLNVAQTIRQAYCIHAYHCFLELFLLFKIIDETDDDT